MKKYFLLIMFVAALTVPFLSCECADVDPLAQTMSMELKDMDVRELLKILTVKSGLTIIPAKNVNGRISVFLNNTPIQDVLAIVCAFLDLAYERKGDVVTFLTAADYRQAYGRDFSEKRVAKTVKFLYADPVSLAEVLNEVKSSVGKVAVDEKSGMLLLFDTPDKIVLMLDIVKEMDSIVRSEAIDLNYADTSKVKDYLIGYMTPGIGKMTVDERTRKVIVTDRPQRLDQIKKIAAMLDAESRQVLIEGRIIQITLSDTNTRGIDWQSIFRKISDLDFKGSFPAGAMASYGEIGVGTFNDDDFNVVFQCLQELGDAKIVSTPRITAVNNAEAKILVGTREAYITQNVSQAEGSSVSSESVQFVDVGVKFNLTPVIGADGFITMKIKPEVSSVSKTVTTANGTVVPIIETSEAETTVKVKDGVTIMLAGLIKENKQKHSSGLPFLLNVPFLKILAGNDKKENTRTELVVFLTPKIVRGDVATVAEK
jgi:type II secretory pathway component GspD/PulD (secretin)